MIHDNDQVPRLVMIQHLTKELDDFDRGDPFLIESEEEIASTADSRHGRHTCPISSDRDLRRVPSDPPGLAEKGGEGHVRFVLEVQNGSVFPDCSADLGNLRSGLLLAGLFVHLIVLPLRLLVCQTSFP